MKIEIQKELVEHLIATQFPKWKHLHIDQILPGGWDNRTFRLGEEMIIRLPSSKEYSEQVEKEQKWLPTLSPLLPLSIPKPIEIGSPSKEYPWKWSIYTYLKGEPASSAHIDNMCDFADTLSNFLKALHSINASKGPPPGPHNFYRGGRLSFYDKETKDAIFRLKDRINADLATKLWDSALKTSWNAPPVWVHGDISHGNLLLENGKLSSVIDFGMLGIGDPACDLSISWTFFEGRSRKVFRSGMLLDRDTWIRAMGWTLWKALIVAVNGSINDKDKEPFLIIKEIINDYMVSNK
jgi:aminoglycoside phosphotransferase (APT) family kinase protein